MRMTFIRHITRTRWLYLATFLAFTMAFTTPSFALSPPKTWTVLGPFPLGSREHFVDTILAFGDGIGTANESIRYPSELCDSGKADWTTIEADEKGTVQLAWDDVRWDFNTELIGQSGSMFYAHAFGEFIVEEADVNEVFTLKVTCVHEVYLDLDRNQDGPHIPLRGGANADFVVTTCGSVNFATSTLQFSSSSIGSHKLYVRVFGQESGSFSVAFEHVKSSEFLVLESVLPDFTVKVKTNDRPLSLELASPYVSLSVLNTKSLSSDRPLIIDSASIRFEEFESMALSANVKVLFPGGDIQRKTGIVSGQIGEIVLEIDLESSLRSHSSSSSTIAAVINATLTLTTTTGYSMNHHLTFALINETAASAYTFTFLDGINIQEASLRPPLSPDECPASGCSVLLSLHGAGVDATSEAWTNAYKPQKHMWILQPTNRGRFGWDWEALGYRNAIAALRYISTLENVDVARVIFGGHSMGGHGTWIASTHMPDLALAVVPAAGWIDARQYVPFFTGVGEAHIDRMLQAVLESSTSQWSSSIYTPNLKAIPLLVRMGGNDESVPPWHLRRFARMVNELNDDPEFTVVSEIPGQPHWFDGVVDDAFMQKFYDKWQNTEHVAFPRSFSLVSTNPASMDSKGYLKILQQFHYNKVSRIDVEVENGDGEGKNQYEYVVSTTNVRRFGVSDIALGSSTSSPNRPMPSSISIDGVLFSDLPKLPSHFCLDDSQSSGSRQSEWRVCNAEDWGEWIRNERSLIDSGPFSQILEVENEKPIIIVHGDTSTDFLYATYLANSLAVQGRVFTVIVKSNEFDFTSKDVVNGSHVILLGPLTSNINIWVEKLLSISKTRNSGISCSCDADSTNANDCHAHCTIAGRRFDKSGTGFLIYSSIAIATGTDVSVVNLAVVTGTDSEGFENALSTFPSHPGLWIPDFMVVNSKFRWMSFGGCEAAGYYDWNMKIDFEMSYFG